VGVSGREGKVVQRSLLSSERSQSEGVGASGRETGSLEALEEVLRFRFSDVVSGQVNV
jgi:hypothetical protein